MIFVAGTMTMDPTIIDQFVRDVAAMRPRILAEPGCHHYSLLVEDAPTGLVNVHEQWNDDDALKVHLTTPWITGFFSTYVGHLRASTVQIYDIGDTRPLPVG